ncbi:ABC transporter ATP-binding protein [Herbiconiux ginsengi]|uniref:Peptide/nickel transport system ATP-binding protein n=1 Tax=Herbiconiux ginsengi TaxID=381665 RepID=A0A1H3PE43_9MICO|nr:ABC transporter ATP-binding protein [Herbiconiux ginsengi]SDY99376.1 peptide/nickel transport system ATP-binding protein [Herbiconiux ginsengi]
MSGRMGGGFARDLTITVGRHGSVVLDGTGIEIAPGQVVGLAGETGSGKSTLGLAMLGHLGPGLIAQSGIAVVAGRPILDAHSPVDPARLRDERGRTVSYVPQDPGSALNPGIRVGVSFAEVLRAHGVADAEARCAELFGAVGLRAEGQFARRYPHELSGGQQQRVAIAIAFALDPALVVMDEPTTGLDVTTKHRVVELVRRLASERDAGVLFISHDLQLLLGLTDRIAVMHGGAIVEEGRPDALLTSATHPYTRKLIGSLPSASARPERPDLESAPAVLEVSAVSARHRRVEVTHEVSFSVPRGGCLAIVGESGSGKTTTARAIAGLHADFGGAVRLHGVDLAHDVSARTQAQRRDIQYVFQNPWGSLNPRRRIGASIAIVARRLRGLGRAEAEEAAVRALEAVGLRADHAVALPQRLSGGQRQRAALARALVARPEVLVCDEITSSLDLSVQAEVVALLSNLQEEFGMAMVFITHDLALASEVAGQTVVLKDGFVVEQGLTSAVLARPSHPYTAQLVAAASASYRSAP